MRREVRFGVACLTRRSVLQLAGWSLPEAVPALVSGLAVAHAIDDGFLRARPAVGLAWLGVLVVASGVGALGSRQVFRAIGHAVESLRDELVRRVVGGALRRSVAGRDEGGALARLTRQVEIARDTYAGIINAVRGFTATLLATGVGALSVAPAMAWLILPPFLAGAAMFVATLGLAAARYRASVLAEERVGDAAGRLIAGVRDVVAAGAESQAAAIAAEGIERQADAERSLFGVVALRMACFVVGGWGPLVALLFAGPWLVGGGLSVGAFLGGLTYVLLGLQPALNQLMSGLGGGGLRFVVTVSRILDAAEAPLVPAPRASTPAGYGVLLRGVTFAYGPGAVPVVKDLDLAIASGDHLAVVGPSGVGKSTLAGILCGLIRPDGGQARLGGAVAADLSADQLAKLRVLIPQEAFVFSGTVRDNLTYLRPAASMEEVRQAVAAVGGEALVERLGGLSAPIRPADLSAGERQLLALGRAYLCAAPVVVLDEATCHLDPMAERLAEEAFAQRGGTLIVIAHRISSALRAKRILVLDGARTAIGDQVSLRRDCALYRDLVGHWDAKTVEDGPSMSLPRPGDPIPS
jgi:ATP-binding cassette subfamily C protein